MHALAMTWILTLAGWRSELQYRANFVIMVVAGVVYQGTGFVFIWVVLSQFHAIVGWTLSDIAFLYGLRLVIHAVHSLIFGRIGQCAWKVQQGEFDRYLVRPLSPLLQLMGERMQMSTFGDLLGGVVLFGVANAMVGLQWTPLMALYLVLAIAGGALVEGGAQLLVAALSFRLLNIGALHFFIDEIFNTFGNYPLVLYGGVARFALTFVVPVAFVAYFPATVLLGRTGELALPLWIVALAPLFGVVWFSLAYRFWRWQLDSYQSAGH